MGFWKQEWGIVMISMVAHCDEVVARVEIL
jgi:hypothetical protein